MIRKRIEKAGSISQDTFPYMGPDEAVRILMRFKAAPASEYKSRPIASLIMDGVIAFIFLSQVIVCIECPSGPFRSWRETLLMAGVFAVGGRLRQWVRTRPRRGGLYVGLYVDRLKTRKPGSHLLRLKAICACILYDKYCSTSTTVHPATSKWLAACKSFLESLTSPINRQLRIRCLCLFWAILQRYGDHALSEIERVVPVLNAMSIFYGVDDFEAKELLCIKQAALREGRFSKN